ncbi:hypothetical protein DTO280E4_8889 [Paecilomyces variotii]|nr:hypothetical protein DTO195F2_4006 [Paecilomyces variotii]KAJ9349833.1 hypothetical protein DTO280E4_8889 [Paecilomyces variotii]KAJ9400430.1 hypothetical protein DTO282F9_2617 [Paecilomyces variotii]
MSRAPESVLAYFNKNPGRSILGYLKEIMAEPSNVVFTSSLRGQDNFIVPVDQLESAIDLAPNRMSGNAIWQISQSTILKVGWTVKMSEAEALILLATKTNIPVPKVFSAYTIGDIGFILMSKVEGEPLGSSWDNMSHEERQSIARQLNSYVLEWRKLGAPFLGSVDGGPCEDIIFKHPWDYTSLKRYGPFQSLEEYKLGVIEALRLSRPDGVWGQTEEELKEKILSYDNQRSADIGVMTHGDLHTDNIIIQNGLVSGIVDWGEAGYSLPEREYFAAKRIAMEESWIEIIPCFIPAFPEEYKLWDEIDRSMRVYSPV